MENSVRESFLDEQYQIYCNNLKETQAMLTEELAGIYAAKKANGQSVSKAFIEVNTLLGSKIKTVEVYGIGPNGKCAVDKDGVFYSSDWASSNSAKMNVSPKMRDMLIHKGDGVGYILRSKRDAKDIADSLIGCKMHKDKYIRWIPDLDSYQKSVHLGKDIYVKDNIHIKNVYKHESEGAYCYGYDIYDVDMSNFEDNSYELIRTGSVKELVDHIMKVNTGSDNTVGADDNNII